MGNFRCRARIELIVGILEWALQALPSSGQADIQNAKVLANSHGEKVHNIVSFSFLQFEAELILGISESALRALSSGSAAIQNEFSWVIFDAELKLS